jgi:hypothetical protein
MKAWLALLCATCVAAPVAATEYYATGKVAKIFALDRGAYGVDSSHILVAGLSSAGSCPTNDGLIALYLRDEESGKKQLAVALTAKMSALQVVVRVDDQIKNANGGCYLKYLELNTP